MDEFNKNLYATYVMQESVPWNLSTRALWQYELRLQDGCAPSVAAHLALYDVGLRSLQ